MRYVVVSPHPDDAVWSCGGLLRRWVDDGHRVTVVTVFDGDPPGAGDATDARTRRAEDRAGVRACDGALVGMGRPEARYRGEGALYASALSRRRGRHPDDPETVDGLAAALRPVLQDADVVVVPAAHRTHVDHLLARAAAERAAAAGVEVLRYDEFPYGGPRPAGEARTAPVDLDRWVDAALAYRSQVTAMFGDAARFATALRHFAGAADGGRSADVTASLWR